MGCHGFLEKMPTFSRPSLFANNHQLIKTCQQNSLAGIARRHSCRSSLFVTQGDLQVYNAMSDCISQPGKILPISTSYHEESSEIEHVGSSWSKSLSANRENPNYTLPLLFLQIPKIASQSPFLVSVIKATTFTGILNMFSDNQALAITDIADMEQSFRSLGDLGDISNGFSSAFLLILFSELGDKTFFIAALLASQKSATAVFIGTFGALAYKTEEYSHAAVNKYNVTPNSIPEWIFDFMPTTGGYFISNVSPIRMDFWWFCFRDSMAILSSLRNPCRLWTSSRNGWTKLVEEMPLKAAYPTLEDYKWRIITGCDPKNTRWSYHNGGSWPGKEHPCYGG